MIQKFDEFVKNLDLKESVKHRKEKNDKQKMVKMFLV